MGLRLWPPAQKAALNGPREPLDPRAKMVWAHWGPWMVLGRSLREGQRDQGLGSGKPFQNGIFRLIGKWQNDFSIGKVVQIAKIWGPFGMGLRSEQVPDPAQRQLISGPSCSLFPGPSKRGSNVHFSIKMVQNHQKSRNLLKCASKQRV